MLISGPRVSPYRQALIHELRVTSFPIFSYLIFLICLVSVGFCILQRYGCHALLPISWSRIQSPIHHNHGIGGCHQTDLFPSRGRLKLVLVLVRFCFFLISTFVLFCEKLVTLLFSVVQKEKRWLQLTQIWNSKEMGHTDGKQQCGDFMGKRRPCCVSGHLRVTYSSISSDRVFGFPQSGFGRPQTRNSSFKNA